MARSKPTIIDRARIRGWSTKRALEELRKHTVNGDGEWAMLLLDKTEYATIRTFLDPRTWKGESPENLRNVAMVVDHLLKSAPQEQLPPQQDPEHIVAAFKQAILRSLPKVSLKPKSDAKRKAKNGS
jgi:hypothetical protein